jgi:hypothetical protein
MLDPAYSEEFKKLKEIINEDRRWYEAEKDRVEEEYKRRSSLHMDPNTFIANHPSSMELERRACIAKLVESGYWHECIGWPRDSPLVFMTITYPGFPETVLSTSQSEPNIPLCVISLIQKYGFNVTIGYKKLY